jgi:uncharacterized spore protein YtfJ
MAEETGPKPTSDEGGGLHSLDIMEDTLGEFLDTASVSRVYGEPIRSGDTVVIPAAEVLVGLGFGLGSGYGQAPNGSAGSGYGSGGGGGGRTLARPVAVITIDAGGVNVQPIVDPTKIVLAALTAGGFIVAMIARMLRPRRFMHHK